MAVSTNNRFSFAIQGEPGVGSDVKVTDAHSSPRYAVGQGYTRADGAKFRYSHFGADTTQGLLVSLDISESSQALTDNIVVAPSSTYQMANEANGVYPGGITSRYVIITLASVTQDQFAGGYLTIHDGTGDGYIYPIIGNTATDTPASGKVRLELAYGLQVALDATSDISIQGNLCANLEAATAATDMNVAGVTVSNVDISDAAYAWIQTKGVAAVYQDGTTIAAGDILALSDDTSGAVQIMGGGVTGTIVDIISEQVIGTCLQASGATQHLVAFLNIE